MLQGDLVLQQSWFNLSCQSPQPSLRLPSISYDPFNNAFLGTNTAADQASLLASLCTDLAFQLGSCLQIQGAHAHYSAGAGAGRSEEGGEVPVWLQHVLMFYTLSTKASTRHQMNLLLLHD